MIGTVPRLSSRVGPCLLCPKKLLRRLCLPDLQLVLLLSRRLQPLLRLVDEGENQTKTDSLTMFGHLLELGDG